MERTMSNEVVVLPDDQHNRDLVGYVHPNDWVNPEPAEIYNLVVIGGGTAGLVAAVGAATVGARVALVEKYLMGGDCLNYGCVPSKAIIRSARVASEIKNAHEYGIDVPGSPEVNFPQVMERMRKLRTGIGHHDSAERFRSLGIDVFLGEAGFSGPDLVEVGDDKLRFKKAVIATGTSPRVLEVEGLNEAGFLTNETVFSLTEKPQALLVVGGGPIGCELAQTFLRLGSQVTLLEIGSQLLPREDRDAADILGAVFEEEGLRCIFDSSIKRVTVENGRKAVTISTGNGEETIVVDEILVGAGRVPSVGGLNLESAGVEYDERKGVHVNDYLQTANPRIYAAGDVCYPYKFTHVAEATARIVVQNALFLKSRKVNSLIIPWCTYTDPEIAHVGMYEKDAREKGIEVDTFIKHFKDVDRAILDGEDSGFVKVHTRKGKDKILGATIVASHAGDMISEFTATMASGKGLKTLANVIHPYPTQADAIKQVSGQYYADMLTPFRQRLLERWFAWKR